MKSQERKPPLEPERPEVIVRSWGNEPVRLLAHGIDTQKQRVFVGVRGARRPISLPWSVVFDFEPETFRSLRGAYTSGNSEELDGAYRRLAVDERSCNKYRNNVYSGHDKEGQIADSKGPSGGDCQ